MGGTKPGLAELITVGETTFARRVRAVTVPVIVTFGAARCVASQALLPIVARLAEHYAEQVLVLHVDVDRSPMLAEQYGVVATPTVLVLQYDEELTRMIGFAPERLVRLLFEHIIAGDLTPGRLWSPSEQAFEDAVIIPLLESWGWTYRRQAACPLGANKPVARGRVDILAYADNASAPLTLFENKRQIASSAALQQAVAQARRYAEAFGMVSFVVAAPAGMWIYRQDGGRARLVQSFSILEVVTGPEVVKHTLRWI